MFVDDLIESRHIEIDKDQPMQFANYEELRSWFNAVFWVWYAVHLHDEIKTLKWLGGLIRRKITYADLHALWIHVFGPEVLPADSAEPV